MPFPADVVKSKIQTETHGLPRGLKPTVTAVSIPPCLHVATGQSKNFYNSLRWFVTQVFRNILSTEGVGGLYRGCGITVARAAPGNGLLFVTYEFVLQKLQQRNQTSS